MKGTGRRKPPANTCLPVALFIAGAAITVYSAVMLASGLQPYREAGQEYDGLRRSYAPDIVNLPVSSAAVTPETDQADQSAPDIPGPGDINPDYAGWLQIPGTDVDYPVVQGADNREYLTKTFEGRENKAGTLFMDYRCAHGFDALHVIIYGHNMKDGSMFGSLARYLEEDYLKEHPEITITLPDNGILTYGIFAVRETDITDPAYRMDFEDDAAFAAFAAALGADEDGGRILTLSTCGNGGDKDRRLLIHGMLLP